MDGDGAVNSADLTYMKRYILGSIRKPAEAMGPSPTPTKTPTATQATPTQPLFPILETSVHDPSVINQRNTMLLFNPYFAKTNDLIQSEQINPAFEQEIH